MTNEEFNDWRQRLGLTYKSAAAELGTSERSVYNYAGGLKIPRYIELACEELQRRYNELPREEHWEVHLYGPTGGLVKEINSFHVFNFALRAALKLKADNPHDYIVRVNAPKYAAEIDKNILQTLGFMAA